MTLTPPPALTLADTGTSVPAVEDLAALTRPDFPLLAQTACLGQPLIYLDYAATSQKPRQVLEALQQYYGHDNANVHRGAHQLSARATDGFEGARAKVAAFVGAVLDGIERRPPRRHAKATFHFRKYLPEGLDKLLVRTALATAATPNWNE